MVVKRRLSPIGEERVLGVFERQEGSIVCCLSKKKTSELRMLVVLDHVQVLAVC
jgi:hypothetical protein